MRRNKKRTVTRNTSEGLHCKPNRQVICNYAWDKIRGRDAPEKLYPLPEELHLLTREHSSLNRGHRHFMQTLPCCMAESVPYNHAYLANTAGRCYPTKHSQGHSTGVQFFLMTETSLGYRGSWATLRRREVKIESIQNILH